MKSEGGGSKILGAEERDVRETGDNLPATPPSPTQGSLTAARERTVREARVERLGIFMMDRFDHWIPCRIVIGVSVYGLAYDTGDNNSSILVLNGEEVCPLIF